VHGRIPATKQRRSRDRDAHVCVYFCSYDSAWAVFFMYSINHCLLESLETRGSLIARF
jgi:hypothetical protein